MSSKKPTSKKKTTLKRTEKSPKKLKSVVLFPRLVATVGLDWVDVKDSELFGKLSSEPLVEEDGMLESIVTPRVSPLGVGSLPKGYVLEQTGCDYDEKVQRLILNNWRDRGASDTLLSILAAAQRQSIAKIIFEKGGMIVEVRGFPKLGKISKKALGRKKMKTLLASLKMMFEDMWPIEQLASIVAPYFKPKPKSLD